MDDTKSDWQQNPDYYQPSASPQLDPIQWTASEFISHQKTLNWYVVLGSASAAVTLIVFVVSRNILSALVVAGACAALGVVAARKPQIKSYQISTNGITIQNTEYSYALFKSFSVIDEGAIGCIWLRPLKKLSPTVAMYYPPDQEESIIMMLENFLPEEDRQHDLVDRLSRRIRF